MDTKQRKELLKAVLQGDKQRVNSLLKDKTLYFEDAGRYYKKDLQTEISKTEFENEFIAGRDILIGFTDKVKQRKAMLDFGVDESEVNEYFLKQPNNEETAKQIQILKERLENE